MLFFIVLFIVIGFVAGLIKHDGLTIIVFVVSVLFTAFTAGPFAIATFAELGLGLGFGLVVREWFEGGPPKNKDGKTTMHVKW